MTDHGSLFHLSIVKDADRIGHNFTQGVNSLHIAVGATPSLIEAYDGVFFREIGTMSIPEVCMPTKPGHKENSARTAPLNVVV
jgi:hypothetical protein